MAHHKLLITYHQWTFVSEINAEGIYTASRPINTLPPLTTQVCCFFELLTIWSCLSLNNLSCCGVLLCQMHCTIPNPSQLWNLPPAPSKEALVDLLCSGSQRPQLLCGKTWLMPNSFILNSLQLNNFWQSFLPFLGVRSTGYFIWMFSLACQVEELDYHYIPINQVLFTKYYRWAKKGHCKAIYCFCCCNGWPFSHYVIVY